jgi:hypothetical protein
MAPVGQVPQYVRYAAKFYPSIVLVIDSEAQICFNPSAAYAESRDQNFPVRHLALVLEHHYQSTTVAVRDAHDPRALPSCAYHLRRDIFAYHSVNYRRVVPRLTKTENPVDCTHEPATASERIGRQGMIVRK